MIADRPALEARDFHNDRLNRLYRVLRQWDLMARMLSKGFVPASEDAQGPAPDGALTVTTLVSYTVFMHIPFWSERHGLLYFGIRQEKGGQPQMFLSRHVMDGWGPCDREASIDGYTADSFSRAFSGLRARAQASQAQSA